MKKDMISKLQEENDRLKYLATHDEMTGILNRRALEEQVEELMPDGGILLVCDLDGFKKINDHYGHMIGDKYIRDTARLLNFLLQSEDLLGRVGGDEFVIFSPGDTGKERMEYLIEKIQNRFLSYSDSEPVSIGISIGGALCQPDDTYASLFQRADEQLLRIKNAKRKKKNVPADKADNWILDMNAINRELSDQLLYTKAKYQDFDSFKTICHFIKRCSERDGNKYILILMSLVSSEDSGVPFDSQQQMDQLGEILQNSLRTGDIFTRYSSCQYLILLINAGREEALIVEKRIESHFQQTDGSHRLIFMTGGVNGDVSL